MSDISITVIVPIFNVETYLTACLDSLQQQTNQHFHVLLIDDGSTDNSATIASSYVEKTPNLFTYYKKPNGGLSDARNFGIDKSTSDYVMFVDSDDVITLNTMEDIQQKLSKSPVDVLCFGMTEIDEDGRHIRNIPATIGSFSNTTLADTPELLTLALPNACNKVVKTSLFKANNILFPKGLWYEDLATIPKLYNVATRIGFMKAYLYHYRTREGSITQTVNPKILDMLEVLTELNVYFERTGNSELNSALNSLSLSMLTKTMVRIASHDIPSEQKSMMEGVNTYIDRQFDNKQSIFAIKGKKIYKIIVWLAALRLNKTLMFFLRLCLKRGLVRA
jgi:glycosyltransferase involved in cell wall biosynthesis